VTGTLTSRAANDLEARLSSLGQPERAEKERAYLKSTLTHLGVNVPTIRRETRASLKTLPDRERAGALAYAHELWKRPVHEMRVAAVEVLILAANSLEAGDMRLLETYIREAKTWALVDGIATSAVGPLVDNHPKALETLDGWARADDFWVRRAAMLALLPKLRAGGGDFERFSRYADSMLGEPEFFVRKAIGWVLRETSKKRPSLVYAWMLPRAGAASGTTVREAIKYLDRDQKRNVLRAYEEGRRASGSSRRKRPLK
jgi:3-methyladenine DNA glycosylase AlkD